MKQLLKVLAFVCLCVPMWGQGNRYDSNAFTSANNVPAGSQSTMFTLPFAKITVCAYPDNGGQPCTNTVPIYQNPGLSVAAQNPITADVHGRFGFWKATGTYTYSIVSAGGEFLGTYVISIGGGGTTTGCSAAGAAGTLQASDGSGGCAATPSDYAHSTASTFTFGNQVDGTGAGFNWFGGIYGAYLQDGTPGANGNEISMKSYGAGIVLDATNSADDNGGYVAIRTQGPNGSFSVLDGGDGGSLWHVTGAGGLSILGGSGGTLLAGGTTGAGQQGGGQLRQGLQDAGPGGFGTILNSGGMPTPTSPEGDVVLASQTGHIDFRGNTAGHQGYASFDVSSFGNTDAWSYILPAANGTICLTTTCGGTLSGQTTGYLPKATSATASTTSSAIDDGVTTASTVTVHETLAVADGTGNAGMLTLKQGTAGATVANSVGLEAPTSVTAYNFKLPAAQGSGCLSNDGSGNGSWAACSGGGTGFPITLGSTAIPASSTTTTLAGLTLTAPTFTTPALGTPASGVLTNATGLPLTTGVTGLLPVANGGTGTATPGIVAGTNVTVSGTWPNQTINSTSGSGNTTSTSLTTNFLPKANGANSIINTLVSESGGALNVPEPVAVSDGTGNGGIFDATEGTAPSATALHDILYADSASHCMMYSSNGGAFACLGTGGGSGIPTSPSNALVKINGSNGAASSLSDSGTALSATEPLTLTTSGNVPLTLTSSSTANTAFSLTNSNVTGQWLFEEQGTAGGTAGMFFFNFFNATDHIPVAWDKTTLNTMLAGTSSLAWTSGSPASTSIDTGISRSSAGNISLDTSTAGNHSANLSLNNLTVNGTCTNCGAGGAWTNITSTVTASGCTVSSGRCVAGSPTSSVSFSAIPGTYNSIVIVGTYNTSDGVANDLHAQFNADTASHYVWQNFFAAGASPGSGGSGALVGSLEVSATAGTGSGSNPSGFRLLIPNYANTTFNKTTVAESTRWSSSTQQLIVNYDSRWESTSAITSVLFFSGSGGNIVTGSTFSIYGVQ